MMMRDDNDDAIHSHYRQVLERGRVKPASKEFGIPQCDWHFTHKLVRREVERRREEGKKKGRNDETRCDAKHSKARVMMYGCPAQLTQQLALKSNSSRYQYSRAAPSLVRLADQAGQSHPEDRDAIRKS
jgi:hypothetical protein